MSLFTEETVETLNNKLDELSVAGTARFSLADCLGSDMSQEALNTCRALIDALSYYDATLLPLSDAPTKDEILSALVPRQTSLSSPSTTLDVIDYLCTHLQAERLSNLNNKSTEKSSLISTEKSTTYVNPGRGLTLFQLDRICKDMQWTELDLISMEESDIVAALVRHLKSVKASLPDGIFDDPPTIIQGISQEELTSEQKQNIQQINSAFIKDFTVRRRMLLKRLDVTIQSFLWGTSVKGKEDEILAVINAQRQHLTEIPTHYTLEDALSAPVSLLHEHTKKVTGGHGRGDNSHLVKKVLIGHVPDRGGRPLTENRAKALIAKESGRGKGGGGRGSGGKDVFNKNNSGSRNNKRGGGGKGHPPQKKGKV